MNLTSILIVGVGGQGTLLASRLLGQAAIQKGWDVKVSEVHGMSQRGGSVVTYVKYSDEAVYSPIIDPGEADVIMAFEVLEAYRSIHYLKKGGLLLVNTQQINPMPVITGAARYPEQIVQKLTGIGTNLMAVDALSLAREAGSEKAVNTVLIGLLAARSEIEKPIWESALKATVPQRLLDINIKAFQLGYQANPSAGNESAN